MADIKDLELLDYDFNISVRAVNLCKKHGIETKDQLVAYYRKHGNFLDFPKCGKQINTQLTETCLQIDPNAKGPEVLKIIDVYGDYHIRSLSGGLLFVRVCKALVTLDILTVRDFMESKEKGLDNIKRCLWEGHPCAWNTLQKAKKYNPIDLDPNQITEDTLRSFKNLLPPLHLSILNNRILKDKKDRASFESIGRLHGVTKERVRQLQKEIPNNFRKFISGDIYAGSYLTKKSIDNLKTLAAASFKSPLQASA